MASLPCQGSPYFQRQEEYEIIDSVIDSVMPCLFLAASLIKYIDVCACVFKRMIIGMLCFHLTIIASDDESVVSS
jgi:hypothetical protein